MVRLFTLLFWLAVIIGATGIFLNTDLGDETLTRLVDYIRIEPEVEVSSSALEARRMLEDRIKQLNELSAVRSQLLHDRLLLIKESEDKRRRLSETATAYWKERSAAGSAGPQKIAELKGAISALNAPRAGAREAEDVVQKVRDLEQSRVGMSATPSRYVYEDHAVAVANMARLAGQYRSATDDLAYQKVMSEKLNVRAVGPSEKAYRLQQQMADADQQMAEETADRLHDQDETTQFLLSERFLDRMEQLSRRYQLVENDLAYQRSMLDNVTARAQDANAKMRSLKDMVAAREMMAYSTAQRLAAQTEAMQNRMAAQMERLAAMQERSSLQMERSYAQLERMYQRMEMMRDRMEAQNARLQAMLERSAAQSERMQAMQERTASMQQRMSNAGSR